MKYFARFLVVGFLFLLGCIANPDSSPCYLYSEGERRIIEALERNNMPVNHVSISHSNRRIDLFLEDCQFPDVMLISRLGSYERITGDFARFDLAKLNGSPELSSLDISSGILLHPEKILEYKELVVLTCCLLAPFEGEELVERVKGINGDLCVIASKESIAALQKCPNPSRYSLLISKKFYDRLSEDERHTIARIPLQWINRTRPDVFWREPYFLPESVYSFFQIPE